MLLSKSGRHKRIFAVLEFSSYTMREGFHIDTMGAALTGVDKAYILQPEKFDSAQMTANWQIPFEVFKSTDDIVTSVIKQTMPHDAVLVMSNRGFDNIHDKLVRSI